MNIVFKKGIENIDYDRVTDWLKDTYWSPGIGRDEVIYLAKNSSVVVGGFDPAGQQASFLRVVSDLTRFAYLADVIVDPAHRGRGIGREMVRYAMNIPELSLVYQWLLRTRDAHGLYAPLGFSVLTQPENWMLIQKPREERPFHLPPNAKKSTGK